MKLTLLWCAFFGALSMFVWGEVPWLPLLSVVAVVGVLLCLEYEARGMD